MKYDLRIFINSLDSVKFTNALKLLIRNLENYNLKY